MKTKLIITIGLALAVNAHAGSATWNLNPTSGDWNTSTNWTPNVVPNGAGDIATFANSNTTEVSISNSIQLNKIAFSSGAAPFTITAPPSLKLTLSGAGVTNASATGQSFVLSTDSAGHFGSVTFSNSAAAGQSTTYRSLGSMNGNIGGTVSFNNTASATGATFINDGGLGVSTLGGRVNFFDNSTAGNAVFIQNGSAMFNAYGGETQFNDASTAANATFTLYGDTVESLAGSLVRFFDTATAANAVFTLEGGEGLNAPGGHLEFFDTSTAANCTIVANGTDFAGAKGSSVLFAAGASSRMENATITINGGTVAGGILILAGYADGGAAQVKVFGNGVMDIAGHARPGMTIGSLEGSGKVRLADNDLTVGSNNLSTTFSGLIGGNRVTLTKIGTGRLTLSGRNHYVSGTVVEAGELEVANKGGSATGSGLVRVKGGTLSGTGSIAGEVRIGAASGPEAILAPGGSDGRPGTLTIHSLLTLRGTATFAWKVQPQRTAADQVVAGGVFIESGALFSYTALDGNALPVGTTFTVIDNLAATPISGTFSNLAEGAVIALNGNNLQASYTGGDGNNLTLTVVP